MKKRHDLAINPRKGRKKRKAVRINLRVRFSSKTFLKELH